MTSRGFLVVLGLALSALLLADTASVWARAPRGGGAPPPPPPPGAGPAAPPRHAHDALEPVALAEPAGGHDAVGGTAGPLRGTHGWPRGLRAGRPHRLPGP